MTSLDNRSGRPPEGTFSIRARVVAGALLAVGLVVGCGGWSAIAQLQGAVITTGTVKVDQNLKEVQHRDGGIVRLIGIRQGDLVKEGQILVALDDIQIKAEHLIVSSQMAESLGRQARLLAERDALPTISFPS